MSEVFDFDGFMSDADDDGNSWNVPPYLRGLYMFWTMTGAVSEQLMRAHYVTENEDPEDTVLTAFMDAPVDEEEEYKFTKGEDHVTAHDLLIAAQGALRLLGDALATRLASLDALPPWWKESDDPIADRPIMGWEILMLRNLLEEDDEDEPSS